ncbi:MAG: hypothetical protein QCH96_07930, partial [Candidatus Thermoplasmatota archaeon]|nr:hypothetical protein [Candidatus Thermoplasmatota archaeon]
MPIELLDLGTLIIGIILFIIPGYLWSYLFLEELTCLERIIFGFILTVSLFILSFFVLDIILKIPITQTKTMLIYAIYTATIIVLYLYSLIKKGVSPQTK